MQKNNIENNGLRPYLSPVAACSLAIGSAIGWGSLVVTGQTYLAEAGPVGSILGLIIGFLMMLMVSSHYHFLANRYPGTGGLYNYIKYVFGYDRAFLIGWFMFLVYIALFWANATSLPLFARYFLDDLFSFGYLYTIFGYEVYLGEVLLTIAAMSLVALLCAKCKNATARLIVALVAIFTVCITVCFVVAMIGAIRSGVTFKPAFVPYRNEIRQVMRIAFLSPWAFIGFESISHSAAEVNFRHTRFFRIFLVSVTIVTLLYIFIILLSFSAYPPSCRSWLDYINRLDEFSGIAGLPAFYAANHYLGSAGVYMLMAALLALVISSLIGMLRALSRLCYAAAKDGVLPDRFAKLNDNQIPVNTIVLVLLLSIPISFTGRTTVGWIVDTCTIGATILYGAVSIAVFKVSGQEKCKGNRFISSICLVILVLFLVFLLFPGVFADHTIGTETYLLMAGWSILGLIFFQSVIRRDHARNFGKAIIVWVALLTFVILVSMTWAERINDAQEDMIVDDILSYVDGTADEETLSMDSSDFLEIQRGLLHDANNVSVLVIAGLFGISLVVMLINYSSMRKWEKKAEFERDEARTAAFQDPLTGVKSKHAFAVEEEKMEAKFAEGEVESFAVILCDVNGLKKINDTLGHKAGDQYIRAACDLLCEYFQHSPVFRVGGDEFVVLLEGRDYETRHDILGRFNEKVESHIGTGDVVASLGLADYVPNEDMTFHEVFKRADKLMYERKKQLKSMGAVTRD